MARRYGRKASKSVESAMRRRKHGTLKSGSGRSVKSRKQAIAIGLNEAREEGAKVPSRSKRSSSKRSSSKRSSSKRSSSKRSSSKRSSSKRSSSKRAGASKRRSSSKRR